MVKTTRGKFFRRQHICWLVAEIGRGQKVDVIRALLNSQLNQWSRKTQH